MLWAGRLDKNMATRKRHSPEQVVRKLATADRMLGEGKDVADVCRELAISEQTYYRWRNQFGGLKADDAKRLKDLERENAALKPLPPTPPPAPTGDRRSSTRSAVRSDWVLAGVRESWREFAAGAERG
jgi:putative transposase